MSDTVEVDRRTLARLLANTQLTARAGTLEIYPADWAAIDDAERALGQLDAESGVC